MKLSGNTVFITGGTSGIGRGLAEAFHARGNRVVVAGRREDRLKQICAAHSGMSYTLLDVTDARAIRETVRKLIADFPAINCVVNNAGVQMHLTHSAEDELDDPRLQAEIATNLLGPIRVTSAFLPQLSRTSGATLINVSSGLAFVPMARFPVYCATKAAVHSWTMSLRRQVRGAGVKVIEIIPPWVATELGGPGKPATTPDGRGPMPLNVFIEETMRELSTDSDEIAVAEAKRLYEATSPEIVRKVFSMMNQ